MTSPDPLDLLIASIRADTPSILLTAASEPADSLSLATYISFQHPGEPVNLVKDTPTRYTSKAGSSTEFYNLAQIWLAWTERDSGVRDYLVKGQAGGSGYVSVADRRGVVEFLQGGDGAGRVRDRGEAEAGPSDVASVEAGPSKVPAKRKYEVDVADREFCRKLRTEEIELRDRNSVLRTCGSGKVNNFESFAKTVMADKIKALRNSLQSGGKPQPQSQSTGKSPSHHPSRGAKKAKSTTPIIVISSSPTALVTLWNVKSFLEDGVFVPSETARQAALQQGNRAEDMVPIVRKRTGPNGEISQRYYVVDAAETLSKFGVDAWDRVICVCTTGQAWQFKSLPVQDPRTLFRNVTGVYFQWQNEPAAPSIRDWNVTDMRIDRSKRHRDRQVVADFWRLLDGAKRR